LLDELAVAKPKRKAVRVVLGVLGSDRDRAGSKQWELEGAVIDVWRRRRQRSEPAPFERISRSLQMRLLK